MGQYPSVSKDPGDPPIDGKNHPFLWDNNDQGPVILPANVPMDNAEIQGELMRYLEEPWRAVIQKDVDGNNALPRQIDSDYPNIGRYSGTRRVARTLFFGSAPTYNAANRGIDEQVIKLGSALPWGDHRHLH